MGGDAVACCEGRQQASAARISTHQVQALAAGREGVMHQRGGAVVCPGREGRQERTDAGSGVSGNRWGYAAHPCTPSVYRSAEMPLIVPPSAVPLTSVHHMAGLGMKVRHPLRKLEGVGQRGAAQRGKGGKLRCMMTHRDLVGVERVARSRGRPSLPTVRWASINVGAGRDVRTGRCMPRRRHRVSKRCGVRSVPVPVKSVAHLRNTMRLSLGMKMMVSSHTCARKTEGHLTATARTTPLTYRRSQLPRRCMLSRLASTSGWGQEWEQRMSATPAALPLPQNSRAPHHAALPVLHVVHLVKHDPRNLPAGEGAHGGRNTSDGQGRRVRTTAFAQRAEGRSLGTRLPSQYPQVGLPRLLAAAQQHALCFHAARLAPLAARQRARPRFSAAKGTIPRQNEDKGGSTSGAPKELGSSVDHGSQNFGGHHHAACLWVERHVACSVSRRGWVRGLAVGCCCSDDRELAASIAWLQWPATVPPLSVAASRPLPPPQTTHTRHQPHVPKLLRQFAELLVAQRLERGGVDAARSCGQRLGDRILCDHRLAGCEGCWLRRGGEGKG